VFGSGALLCQESKALQRLIFGVLGSGNDGTLMCCYGCSRSCSQKFGIMLLKHVHILTKWWILTLEQMLLFSQKTSLTATVGMSFFFLFQCHVSPFSSTMHFNFPPQLMKFSIQFLWSSIRVEFVLFRSDVDWPALDWLMQDCFVTLLQLVRMLAPREESLRTRLCKVIPILNRLSHF
jgi:hypothetical protein